MIQVGWAGPQSIIQHQGKKKCRATKQAKAGEVSAGNLKQTTLPLLGFSRENHRIGQLSAKKGGAYTSIITAVDPGKACQVLLEHACRPDMTSVVADAVAWCG